jgi:hypothetical protein
MLIASTPMGTVNGIAAEDADEAAPAPAALIPATLNR